MILTKLYEIQLVLKERIGYDEDDRFDKLMLGFLAEVSECANEQRSWKYWSKKQEPNVYAHKPHYIDVPVDPSNPDGPIYRKDIGRTWNPLLEEYVDGLHLVLEIGLDLKEMYPSISLPHELNMTILTENVTKQFKNVIRTALILEEKHEHGHPVQYPYIQLLKYFLGLGEMLGFTEEEIKEAYLTKKWHAGTAASRWRSGTG